MPMVIKEPGLFGQELLCFGVTRQRPAVEYFVRKGRMYKHSAFILEADQVSIEQCINMR